MPSRATQVSPGLTPAPSPPYARAHTQGHFLHIGPQGLEGTHQTQSAGSEGQALGGKGLEGPNRR